MNQSFFWLIVAGCIVMSLIIVVTTVLIYLISARKINLIKSISLTMKAFIEQAMNSVKGFSRNNDIASTSGQTNSEENLGLLKRIKELEQELTSIKLILDKRPFTFKDRIQRGFNFVLNHWALLSFIGSIFILLYIQLVFHVDYFENVRDISTQKKLSDFYRIEGDNLLDASYFDAANGSYKKAIEIDPNNELAMYGLAMSSVFEPDEGQTYVDYYSAERKLNYLLSQFPNDFHLLLLKSSLYDARFDTKTALQFAEKALQENPNCAPCLVQLGYLNQKSNVLESAQYYEKALKIDPEYPYASNNLGFIYLLRNDYKNSETYLSNAYYWSPQLITLLNLGDTSLYSNNLNLAKYRYEIALSVLNDSNIKPEDRFLAGAYVYNYMPLKLGDVDTIKLFDVFSTIDEKKMLGYYNLSFTYALMEDFDKANELFHKANALDSLHQHNKFFASKLVSIKNLIPISQNAVSWVNGRILELSQSH